MNLSLLVPALGLDGASELRTNQCVATHICHMVVRHE